MLTVYCFKYYSFCLFASFSYVSTLPFWTRSSRFERRLSSSHFFLKSLVLRWSWVKCQIFITAWKMSKCEVFLWSLFSCIRTEYREIRTRKNSVFGHSSRSVWIFQVDHTFYKLDVKILATSNEIEIKSKKRHERVWEWIQFLIFRPY